MQLQTPSGPHGLASLMTRGYGFRYNNMHTPGPAIAQQGLVRGLTPQIHPMAPHLQIAAPGLRGLR